MNINISASNILKRLGVVFLLAHAVLTARGEEYSGSDKPLPLTGKPPEAERLREAASRGMEYLLAQQRKNGSWKYDAKTQLGAESVSFLITGQVRSEAPPPTMTALVCMALRRSEKWTRRNVDEAVARGRVYLLENSLAARAMKGGYLPWGEMFCIRFLCGEYERADGDEELRNRLLQEIRRLTESVLETQRPDGGWGYHMVHSLSFMTADAILALQAARGIGVAVPDGKIEAAARYLEKILIPGGGAAGEKNGWYPYLSDPRAVRDIREGMGRIAVCELALFKAGKRSARELAWGLERFLEHREELDKMRSFPGTHGGALNMAAYYFLYGHANAARAANKLEDLRLRERVHTTVQEVLLAIQQKDGTWCDHPGLGKLYGTAMALMGMGETTQPDTSKKEE